MGTLHKSLVRAEAAALSPQCREASGLSADSLARAEPLDKVLQQVSAGARVSGDMAGPRDISWRERRQAAGPGMLRPNGLGGRTSSCCLKISEIPACAGHSWGHLTFQPFQGSTPTEPQDGGYETPARVPAGVAVRLRRLWGPAWPGLPEKQSEAKRAEGPGLGHRSRSLPPASSAHPPS